MSNCYELAAQTLLNIERTTQLGSLDLSELNPQEILLVHGYPVGQGPDIKTAIKEGAM